MDNCGSLWTTVLRTACHPVLIQLCGKQLKLDLEVSSYSMAMLYFYRRKSQVGYNLLIRALFAHSRESIANFTLGGFLACWIDIDEEDADVSEHVVPMTLREARLAAHALKIFVQENQSIEAYDD